MTSVIPAGPGGIGLAAFCARHLAALQADQVRHNIVVAMLERVAGLPESDLRLWSLGGAGQCAAMAPGRPIVLAELDRQQCRRLAEATRDLAYPGVLGPDDTARWFAADAESLGVTFAAPTPQRILALAAAPRHPGVEGAARLATAADAAQVAEWVEAFIREAVPHDPVPPRATLEQRARDGTFCLWEVGGRPVSMAAVSRRTRDTAAISSVYTPPAERGRGYAGAVTAGLVERIFAEGRATACLYTDAGNPFANRCYEKIGFRQVCESCFFPRVAAGKG